MATNGNETKPKRKRGRPPKKKVELPEFKSENEIRDYILKTSLELALECKEIATKKNNIKKTTLANAKNNQYKTALESLKVVSSILKDLQLSKLSEKVELMEEGLIASTVANGNEETLPSEAIEKIEKLTLLTEQLAELKE